MIDHDLGNLFIVAAPSGGGKTSLVRQLISRLTKIEVSISYTTRPPRPTEKNGVDYFFIDEQTFKQMIQAKAFIEYAQVYEHWYGTAVGAIQDRLQAGIDVVLDIDWQGAREIKRIFADAVSIFILPPSLEILQQRLLDRRQDDAQVIQYRMTKACEEMSHYAEFDYLVINDQFEKAASDLMAIVDAHRLQKSRQVVHLRKLLSFLVPSQ